MASTFSGPVIAPWVSNFLAPATNQLEQFQAGAPNLLQLYQNMPQLQVPGLDPTQQTLLGDLTQMGQNNPDITAAKQQLAQLTGGPIGSSPATQAGMQAFQQLEAPIIEQQSALRGTAGGGQAIEALGQGATQAALPLIQQEISNREAAVGQLGTLGQQQMSQLSTALEAAGLPREVALEQAQALFQRQQQQTGFASNLQQFPLQFLGPAGFGTTTSQPTNTLGNIIGAIGPVIAALAAA